MKYLYYILLAAILISSFSLSSCRRAYLAGQESALQSGAPNTPAGSPAPSNPPSTGFPVIDRFDAYSLDDDTLGPKEHVWGLSWSVSNATSVTLSPGIGAVALAENRTVSPRTTTTYTLTAKNALGSRSKSITLAP